MMSIKKIFSRLYLYLHKLDLITRTMSILDNRLTLTEDRISSLLAHQRGLVVTNAHTVVAGNGSKSPGRAFITESVDENTGFDGEQEIENVGQLDPDDV